MDVGIPAKIKKLMGRVKPVKCVSCGYDMRTQLRPTGATCPECGKFSPYIELFPRFTWRSVGVSWYLLWCPFAAFMAMFAAIAVAGLIENMVRLSDGEAFTGVNFASVGVLPVLFGLFAAAIIVPRGVNRRSPREFLKVAAVFLCMSVTLAAALFAGLALCVFSFLPTRD